MAEQFANFGKTTLASSLTAGSTSVSVTDGSVFPATGDFRINVEDELMLVTARSGNTLTVTRGIEGTTAASHDNGNLVRMVLTATGLANAARAYAATLGWYGDGSDGAATISADTSLTRDMYYTTLTVDSGKTLNTNGYRVFVQNTLTNNGTICRTPNRGNDGGTGGSALADGTLKGAPKGGDRTTTSGSAAGGAGSATTTSGWGGNGGAGGQSSGGGAGGAAGTNTYTLGHAPRSLPHAIMGAAQVLGTFTAVSGGSGGGAGGSTGLLGNGGGGGSGGGVVVICAKQISNGSGVIHARGGDGGNGQTNVGAGGGGGGGGGGVLVLVYDELTGPGTIDAAGGTKGTAGGVSPAADGSNGNAGKVIQLSMRP